MAATTTQYHQHQSHFSPPSHPSTPRLMNMGSPRHADRPVAHTQTADETRDTTELTTPTKSDFGGIPGQRPLPATPFSPAEIVTTPDTERSESEAASKARHRKEDSEDIEMGDDDDQGDSDNDSNASDSKPRKKKKGQRFFCTDFPPCNLSFTRSEHLARHIRKHTGERPFQCHCSRRFSRLDNLRQHAQTVHVNEEIPGDSLAATGTRFQRQIRTDRVRAPGGRSRAGTGGSIGSHVRGHSRNLSGSSVVSTASAVGNMPDDGRRRPPPLAMANQGVPPTRMTLESYGPAGNAPTAQYAYYQAQSPSGYSTPTSATFSTGGNSPRFPVQSPSLAPRAAYYPPTSATSARRLSVPSVPSPYQQGHTYPPAYYSPHPPAGFHQSTASTSSIMSPTSSTYSHSRRESDAELEWRRRTWHPGTYSAHVQRPATSGLMYQQTPDDARPTTAGHPAASQVTRLPGIESFDHAPAAAPAAARPSSPMQIDNTGRPPVYFGPMDSSAPGPDDRRSNSVWEASLHQNLHRLDIRNATPPRHPPAAVRSRAPLPTFHFPQAPPTSDPASAPTSGTAVDAARSDHLGVNNRRQGWYGGPASHTQPINIAQQRRSPEESGSSDGVPTPSTSQGTEANPAIVHANGMVVRAPYTALSEEHQRAVEAERNKPEPVRTDSGSHVFGHYPTNSHGTAYILHSGHDGRAPPPFAPQPRPGHDMGRLEALVAVATSENAQR
ncbi:hypothetical protein CAC42_6834 [Sphaceloma murrayae]|uniref:C2H2-type domain-containing protein n=1 Tax=Sphaceloma murrayae TaxID=2082308 RepID=A0A2K1QHB3_9PEZI|nr:hypothetical protein CAC42_6834 [Sphaceloma murrayae]